MIKKREVRLIGVLLCFAQAALAVDEGPAKPLLVNAFFAFDNGTGRGKGPLDQQAQVLKELGYAGVGFTGTGQIPEMLKALDQRGLKMFSIYVGGSLDGEKPRYDPGLSSAVQQLKGRDTVIWLYVTGKGPASPEMDQRAVQLVGEVADLAAPSGLRVALYPHTGFYLARVEDALRIVKRADRKNLGLTFNLCHFLKLDDERNIQSRLRDALPYLLAVNINGSDRGPTNQMGWDRLIQTLDRGDFDLCSLLKTLKRLGYTGPIGLQCYAIKGDTRENLSRSMDAWRKCSAQLAAEVK